MLKKQKLKWLSGVAFACLGCLGATPSQETIEASRLGATHIGTFEGSTTFTTSSENGIHPGLFIEVMDDQGNLIQYESEEGVVTIPNTKEGSTVKRAILKGQTLVNLAGALKSQSQVLYDFELTQQLDTSKTYFIPFMVDTNAKIGIECGILSSPGSWNAVRKSLENGYNKVILKLTSNPVYALRIRLSTNDIMPEGHCFNVSNAMVIEYKEGMENWDIPYFEDMNSVQVPFLSISNIDGTKMSELTIQNHLILRSNGEVYDELDLITGTLTQRIDEKNEVLPQEIVTTVDLNSTQTFPLLDKSFIQVEGNVSPVITSITVPTSDLSFTIDTNQKDEQQFIAPEFEVMNKSNAPLTLTVKNFEQTTSIFNDVLPTKYASWDGLNKEESKDIALGLVTKPSNDWLNHVDQTRWVIDSTNKELGTIKPKGTVGFEFIAHHGQAFSEMLSSSYRLTFVFDLLQ